MTKKAAKPARAPREPATVILREGKGRVRTVFSFGSAEFQGTKVHAAVPPETLEQSRNAMRKLGVRLLKPGVKLPDRRGVPKFYADEQNPALIIRELDGKRERGRFENGQFKVDS